MIFLLKRKCKGPVYTIGDLFIDGKFFCNTQEDTVRILPLLCLDTPQGINAGVRRKCMPKRLFQPGIIKWL